MKTSAIIIFLLVTHVAFAQRQPASYALIDWSVLNIEATSPGDLARKLAQPYKTDREKARAIFSWIAQHISYYQPRVFRNGNSRPLVVNGASETDDTSTKLKPVELLVAEEVLKKRTAFCYGYSRLFKCLCDLAGIPCEVINGYARGDFNKIGKNFRTNHSWNAIRLDSSWYLVDVTWSSGHFTYNTDEFIQHFDDKYFLMPPEQFAQDHFPDDLEWSLLQQPPAIGEFRLSPYKSRYFVKYQVSSYSPEKGIIKASVGDTINLEVKTNLAADRRIGGGSLYDSSFWSPLLSAAVCRPTGVSSGNTINYSYVVQSPQTQWLQLVYNDDVILRYKLEVRDKKEE